MKFIHRSDPGSRPKIEKNLRDTGMCLVRDTSSWATALHLSCSSNAARWLVHSI